MWHQLKKELIEHILLVLGFSSHPRVFPVIWNRHHYQRAANFDLYTALVAIEQWRLFACHTCCDTGHSFIMDISDNTWHSHRLSSDVIPVLPTLVCRRLDSNNRPFESEANVLTDCATAAYLIKQNPTLLLCEFTAFNIVCKLLIFSGWKILVNEKRLFTYWCKELNLDAEHRSTLTSPYMSEIFLSR